MHKENTGYYPKKLFFPNLLFLICCIALGSCSDTDQEEADTSFRLRVKITDPHGQDITSGVEIQELTLFIFDEKENFLEKKTVNGADLSSGTIHIQRYKDQSNITLVAWGYAGNNSIITMEEPKYGSPISDLKVKLTASEPMAQSTPFELFHGIQKTGMNAQEPITLELKDRIGSLCVICSPRETESEENEYMCQVLGLYNTLDYKGEPTGEQTEYSLPLRYTSDNQWQSEKLFLMPGDFQLELYQNGTWIKTVEKETESGEHLRVTAGETILVVLFP